MKNIKFIDAYKLFSKIRNTYVDSKTGTNCELKGFDKLIHVTTSLRMR